MQLPILEDIFPPPWNFKFDFPRLDVKVVNNSTDVIFFHKAKFMVSSSRLDPRPIPFIREGIRYPPYVFHLENYGWGGDEAV